MSARAVGLVLLSACSPREVPPPAPPPAVEVESASATAPADSPPPQQLTTPSDDTPGAFRSVDWGNREYIPGLVYLEDGLGEMREYSDEYGGMHDTTAWRLLGVAYGDLDADGSPEAAVLISEDWYAPNGGSSGRRWLFVYSGGRTAPLLRATTQDASGDRIEVRGGEVLLFDAKDRRLGGWSLKGDRLEPSVE